MGEKQDSFKGKIGSNIAQGRGEVEENILRILYEWWVQDAPLEKDRICEIMGFTRKKLSFYLRTMRQHGYIEESAGDECMELTDFGKEQGHECLDRHQNIMHFIQLTCNLDETTAEENACRMEHVVGNEVIEGILNFLRDGETYDNEIRNMNFNALYEEGSYHFRMTLYESDKRYPRVLAKEFAWFNDEIIVDVGPSSGRIRLMLADENQECFLWYRRGNEWKKSNRVKNRFLIPLDVFSVTMSKITPITEGMAMIGITDEERQPEANECRELNIHMW